MRILKPGTGRREMGVGKIPTDQSKVLIAWRRQNNVGRDGGDLNDSRVLNDFPADWNHKQRITDKMELVPMGSLYYNRQEDNNRQVDGVGSIR
jgi:hypothetical protein